ncbi:MAG: putative nucleotidyltransferase [Clostridiales bacterium]|jgi:predicted nucleotidyltransferase|nr:putative nucleotidyltransferase [Clostridiales bacterium]
MKRKGKKVEEITTKIILFFKKHKDVAAVFLFGSFGTEYQTEYSDIDLGILFLPDTKVGLKEELELDAALSLALGTNKIDLVNLNKTPIQLCYRAITDGDLIYEGDYVATSNFLEKTYRNYLDYAYDLKVFEQERSKALKEAYRNGR